MLQFITHSANLGAAALQGGCTWIQLRMKNALPEEIAREAEILLPLCRKCGATLIIDDHVEVARAVGAHGVHLGKNDRPVPEARKILGPDAIIGATANTAADVQRAVEAGADYIGLGPFRFTITKANLSPVLGLEGYSSILKAPVPVPVVAIGGITAADIEPLIATGVDGIAVSGAIAGAENPILETQKLIQICKTLKNKATQRATCWK